MAPVGVAEGERRMLAAFCAALPELRVRAERGFWADTLDMHVTEVAGGASVVAACRELDLSFGDDIGSPSRGGEPDVTGGATNWLPKPEVSGDYFCPLRRCSRRAGRDESGRPPRCALADKQ